MTQTAFDVLLFDLGGVLIQHSGIATMLEWTGGRLSVNDLWQHWLVSDSVRKFETGLSSPEEFSDTLIREFSLPVDSATFLNAFTQWSQELFPGTIPLLKRLGESFQLASLSNTNPIHWNTVCTQMKLVDLFDYNFPSHETGLIKPDRKTFEYVAGDLPCPPERIVFFDDIAINVERARQTGMSSYQVSGIDELTNRLDKLGIL